MKNELFRTYTVVINTLVQMIKVLAFVIMTNEVCGCNFLMECREISRKLFKSRFSTWEFQFESLTGEGESINQHEHLWWHLESILANNVMEKFFFQQNQIKTFRVLKYFQLSEIFHKTLRKFDQILKRQQLRVQLLFVLKYVSRESLDWIKVF